MGSNDFAMVTNTASSALEEEEIELELGLSIGGSYKRRHTGANSISDSTFDRGSRDKQLSCQRSCVSRCFNGDTMQEIDPKTKREILALRRKEAKKKREEKQLKKGLCKGYLNGGQLINGEINASNNNGMRLKVKVFQAKERVADSEERQCKKSKSCDIGSDGNDAGNMNPNLCIDQNRCLSYPLPSTSSPVHPPLLSLQYSHPPLHGPPENGFVFPQASVNAMPCWFPSGNQKNLGQVQPLIRYGFVPFQAASISGRNLGNGYDLEHNGSGGGGGNRNAGSNGSATCTSSTDSDHRSYSHHGGGRSDTRSHSSLSEPEQPELNSSNITDAKGSFEHSATSPLTDSAQVNDPTNHAKKMIPSNSPQSSPIEPKLETEQEPSIATPESPTMAENRTQLVGKSPKPPITRTCSLPYMPCVSTTGNGPNGKTINGFLYRYTKTEVSIICVCHGTSFSPAEFVQHSGGTDVSHPLRHITVIPSPF